MACDRFGLGRVLEAVQVGHVGRVARDHIKRGAFEKRVGLSDISADDVDPVFEPVETDAPRSHLCALFLDLESGEMPALCLGGKQKGEYPCPRSEIKAGLAFFDLCKSGEQDGVHSETESVRVLDAIKPAKLQIIRTLAGL